MMNIDFPFHFDSRGRTASTGEADHVRDMIEQFLFTNAGERVNRPDFGSGLLARVFEPNSPELATALQFTIQAGLQRWLGELAEVRQLEVASREGALSIDVVYALRRTGETRRATFAREAGDGI
jgi:phage baseplate assembly protein W